MQSEITLRQAAQQALKSMDDHMYRADTHEFYEAKEALRAALAEPEQYDQTALELCNVCGWKTLIPGDACLNCERQALAEPEKNPFDDDAERYVRKLREYREYYNSLRDQK